MKVACCGNDPWHVDKDAPNPKVMTVQFMVLPTPQPHVLFDLRLWSMDFRTKRRQRTVYDLSDMTTCTRHYIHRPEQLTSSSRRRWMELSLQKGTNLGGNMPTYVQILYTVLYTLNCCELNSWYKAVAPRATNAGFGCSTTTKRILAT